VATRPTDLPVEVEVGAAGPQGAAAPATRVAEGPATVREDPTGAVVAVATEAVGAVTEVVS
jgi:hypothetical protein